MTTEQLAFDFGVVGVKRADTAQETKRLAKLDVPDSFLDEAPAMSPGTGHQDTLAKRMEAAELERPDPLEHRIPVPGDSVEVLWAKGWPSQGWASGQVSDLGYDQKSLMSVRMDFKPFTCWACYVSRKQRAGNPNVEKGPLWRWPPEAPDV